LKYKGINKSSLCYSEEIIKCVGAAIAHEAVAELKWSWEHCLWPSRHRST